MELFTNTCSILWHRRWLPS